MQTHARNPLEDLPKRTLNRSIGAIMRNAKEDDELSNAIAELRYDTADRTSFTHADVVEIQDDMRASRESLASFLERAAPCE